MISEDEWNALPEEERSRRLEEFETRLRQILSQYDTGTSVAVLKSLIAEMSGEEAKYGSTG